MALVLADRVEQVTRTTGLGDLTLGETLRGRQSFQDVTNNGDTVIYVLEDAEGVEWEIGTGTVVHGTTTVLQRTTIRQSSNSDAKISLSAGTHRVFLAADASYLNDLSTSVPQAIADHVAESDPHAQYLLDTEYTQDQLRASLLEEATLYADFANGDYRLYEGVGSGLVRNKAFSDLFTFTRSSDATGYGVSSLETVTTDVQRLVYSPIYEANRKRQGFLIEESRTRLNTIAAAPTNPEDVTVTATAHTISFFGTGTVTLSGAFSGSLVGTGANDRVTLTFTPTAGTLTLTPSGTVENLQLEAGSFETSVILGEGSQVPRSADDCVRTLGAEFNADEFTIYGDFDVRGTGETAGIFILSDGTNDNRVGIEYGTDGLMNVFTSSENGANVLEADVTSEKKVKLAIAVSFGEVKIHIGGVGAFDFSNSIPVGLNTFRIGLGVVEGTRVGNGYYKGFHIFPRALSATELQALTAP